MTRQGMAMDPPEPNALTLVHLCDQPQFLERVAHLIWNEFWTDKPDVTAAHLAARLGQSVQPGRMPLCLVALMGGEPVGVVNLVDNDDDERTHWHPWLAGLVVVPDRRGQGVGTRLVRRLLDEAWQLGFERVHFGTDGPGFYQRLGAVVQERAREDFVFMRFDRPLS